MKFEEMNLIEPLNRAITESGYTTPTPIQEATITTLLSGRDVLGCAQTGTGKTAAFALPILQLLSRSQRPAGIRPIRALVLAPTRELAIQNYDAFVSLGAYLKLRATAVFGGVSQERQVNALKNGVDILVATPGRLLDLINQGFVALNKLEVFVLDEADRMLDMGFIHDVKKIIALLPKERQTLLFSATMPKEVESLALSLLTDPETIKVDPVTSTVDKIEQRVYFVEKDDKKNLLLWLFKENVVSTALVFTRTKSNADQVVRILCRSGISAMAIHGNKSQNARQEALSRFKSGKIAVLAATDIAARGIDINELPYVINYNIPEESETYIHRIGRTGRAGLEGIAISICCSEELKDWHAIERLTKADIKTCECPWSVTGMKPTPKPKKEPRPPRAERQEGAQSAGRRTGAPHKENRDTAARREKQLDAQRKATAAQKPSEVKKVSLPSTEEPRRAPQKAYSDSTQHRSGSGSGRSRRPDMSHGGNPAPRNRKNYR